MIDWTSILIACLGGGSIVGLINGLINWRSNKRKQDAEATREELVNVRSVIEMLQDQINELKLEMATLRSRLNEKDITIHKLYDEQAVMQKKYSQKKLIINTAFECANSHSCPVLIKLNQIEENELKEVSKIGNDENQ